MNILVVGGTRFFGVPMVEQLLKRGHDVTLATRGRTPDTFGDRVRRIVFDRREEASIRRAFSGRRYDVVIDKIAYSSNDVRMLLEHVSCLRYLLMSSAAVYDPLERDTLETAFDPHTYPLVWCDRPDFDYGEIKRQAECAVSQRYPGLNAALVRYPVVLGPHDYTGRLRFYVERVLREIPMFIDDMEARLSFIGEREAGAFLAHLAETGLTGAVNGASAGDVSVKDILDHIERRTGRRAILSEAGEPAPYNGYPAWATLNTRRAAETGFVFSGLHDWLGGLIDQYIQALT